jgi:anaerobic ribonucleoside-triphosphate reductase
MSIIVIKRDGRPVPFDSERIRRAVTRAAESQNVELPAGNIDSIVNSISAKLVEQYGNNASVDVESIQNLVEKTLVDRGFYEIAKHYILYRESRAKVRESNTKVNKAIEELIKLDAEDSDTKRENANIDGNTMCGSMLRIGGTVTKEYFFDHVIKPEYKLMHEQGILHIHDADLSLFSINCLYLPLKKLLATGFNTGHGFLRSPANIQSAAALACIALQSNQNDMFGGQSYPSLDYDLAPYVAKTYIRNVIEYLLTKYSDNELYTKDLLKKEIVSVVDAYIKEHDHLMTEEGNKDIHRVLDDFSRKYDQNLEEVTDHTKFTKMINYASNKTDRDVYQAMEAMMYNFNTLQCLPPWESFYVFDTVFNRWYTVTAEVFHKSFVPGHFKTYSLNINTGMVELKEITGVKALPGNTKKMLKVTDATGKSLTTTFDHRYLTLNSKMEYAYAQAQNLHTTIHLDVEEERTHLCPGEYEDLERKISVKLYKSEVMKIEEVDDEPIVYDISVADNENFLTEAGMIVHNSRSGGQTPFSSVNFGTDTSEEGRMISKNLLLNIKKGLGSGETAIFPIAVFKILKGTTDKGSKNYDLYRLACEVSALRMFPNFVNVSAPMNFQYYKPGHPETEIAAMGAIDSGLVKLVYLPNDPVNSIHSDYLDISKVKEWLEENDLVTTGSMIDFDSHTHYYNVKDGVAITDNTSACFSQVKKFMIFDDPNKTWVKVSYRICGTYAGNTVFVFNNTINVTEDHPLAVRIASNKTKRVFARDLKVGDNLVASAKLLADVARTEDYCSKIEITVESVRKTKNYTGYDFETSTDKFDIGDIVSHNCRTRVIGNSYDTGHQQVTGRGNLFFTTLNLPYLALLAKETADESASDVEVYHKFMELVDKHVDAAVDISRERFAYISKRKAKNFPFLMGQHLYLGSENLLPDDTIEEVIKQGSISVGFIGLAETLTCIFGKHHGESEKSQQFGLEIIGHLHDLMEQYSKSENMNYSLFATPAEGCSGRLLRACKKRFGIVKGVTDKEYLTNSMHVPVGYEISAADKVDIEAPYHPLCTAGKLYAPFL